MKYPRYCICPSYDAIFPRAAEAINQGHENEVWRIKTRKCSINFSTYIGNQIVKAKEIAKLPESD